LSDDLRVDVSVLDDLIAQFENAPEVVDQEARKAMIKSLAVFLEAVTVRTPVVFGILRGSIAAEVFGTPLTGDFEGEVTHAVVYGDAVEFGRDPGKQPPVAPLVLWAKRKFSLSDDEARGVAFVVAERIGEKGTEGKFMFKRGFEASEQTVARIWDQLTVNIVEAL